MFGSNSVTAGAGLKYLNYRLHTKQVTKSHSAKEFNRSGVILFSWYVDHKKLKPTYYFLEQLNYQQISINFALNALSLNSQLFYICRQPFNIHKTFKMECIT